MELSAKAVKLKQDAELMGHYGQVAFYEDPIAGEDAPLLAILDGKVRRTNLWEWDRDCAEWWIEDKRAEMAAKA